SLGLSTIEAGEYTQRRVSFLLSFRRAEQGSLVGRTLHISSREFLNPSHLGTDGSRGWKYHSNISSKIRRRNYLGVPARSSWFQVPTMNYLGVPARSSWFQVPTMNHISTIFGSCWFGSPLQSRPLQPLDLMIPTRSSHHQHQYQWTIQ
ncbi:hypothetical protein HID58_048411, partial [Brassica napus]